jgi:hypothetical protein
MAKESSKRHVYSIGNEKETDVMCTLPGTGQLRAWPALHALWFAPLLSIALAAPAAAQQNDPVIGVVQRANPLKGWVDLHTHPLSNLGFGGKVFYGGVDVGSELPADPEGHHVLAASSMPQALGHDVATHGFRFTPTIFDPFKSEGDLFRLLLVHVLQLGNNPQMYDPPSSFGSVLGDLSTSDFQSLWDQLCSGDLNLMPGHDAEGYPSFRDWPDWRDTLHQKMWVDWVRRSWAGGQRVLVALAVNNKTLADLASGPGDGPDDDKASADKQIAAIKAFVARHGPGTNDNFMQVAYSADDVDSIVRSNRLAVVIGTEIDNIGDFADPSLYPVPPGPSQNDVAAEISRLYGEGVRYIFPIHLIDSVFGGTAAYLDQLNFSSYMDGLRDQTTGKNRWWQLGPSPVTQDPNYVDNYDFDPVTSWLESLGSIKNLYVYPFPLDYSEGNGGTCNQLGLTQLGQYALSQMMALGMLIDIDHMSDLSKDQTIAIAMTNGYPLNSGHAGLRDPSGGNERSMKAAQYAAIAALHGMAGIGSGNITYGAASNGHQMDAWEFSQAATDVLNAMGTSDPLNTSAITWLPGCIGFGTDTNGLTAGMPPRVTNGKPSSVPYPIPAGMLGVQDPLPISGILGSQKTWDYNVVGVAHYGMLPDFLADLTTYPGSATMPPGKAVFDNMVQGAEYFYQEWKICEGKSNPALVRAALASPTGE